MNWFAHPLLMKEILDVVSQVQNLDRAISKLQLRNFDIFKYLKKSSLHGWFEKGSYTQLKPNYQRAFELGKTAQGRPREEMFKNYPGLREIIIGRLRRHRDTGPLQISGDKSPKELGGKVSLYHRWCVVSHGGLPS